MFFIKLTISPFVVITIPEPLKVGAVGQYPSGGTFWFPPEVPGKLQRLAANAIGSSRSQDALRLARKAGLIVEESGPHTKIFTPSGSFVTTIPRHTHLNPNTAKGIVKAIIGSAGE